MNKLISISVLEIILLLTSVIVRNVGGSECEGRTTCGECMESPFCVWCQDPRFDQSRMRCMRRESITASECNSIVDLLSIQNITQDDPLSLKFEDSTVVQVKPQAVNLRLRPGKPVNVTVTAGHAENFPVDLYFLMDLSWSMRNSRDFFTDVIKNIIDAIKHKTDDVKLGFGSFIDKNVPPFTSAVQEFNCNRDNPKCSPPYSFYHRQRLEDITPEEFKKAVLEAPLSGNVDDPEGSLDALMQSMVCTERIGWRDNSRKLLLLFTDRDFHFALDGKLAGILPANDGKCHLNETGNGSGYYTMGETQDYPSVGQISKVANDNNFIILFAVNEKYRQVYQGVVDQIAGSSVDVLSKDGSNIVEIVKAKYNQITTSITLAPTEYHPNVKTKFFSRCNGKLGSEMIETSNCTDMKINEPVEFLLEVTLDSCDVTNLSFNVSIQGLSDKLTLNISSECECPCERNIPLEESEECNGNGQLVCGACQCNDKHFGRRCQCSGVLGSGDETGEDQCRKSADSLVCSGRGQCTCGTCLCDPDPRGNITGVYCQCDDWSCPRSRDGKLCNGRGTCECGKCACQPGWTGNTCECPLSESTCVSPYDGEVCSGHGRCTCGACTCYQLESGKGIYTGKYCERNPIDGNGACGEVRECVECQNFPQDGSDSDCSQCVFESSIIELNDTNIYMDGGMTKCTFENQNGCMYSYYLGLNLQGKPEVLVISRNGKIENCGTPQSLVLGVGAGVLLVIIGLVTICCYKIFIEVNDRRQYAKFLREVDMTRNAVNQMPNEIYKSPITKFKNPTYGQQ